MMNGDRFAGCLAEMWTALAPYTGSRVLRGPGAAGLITGLPQPEQNGVWPQTAFPRVRVVADLLDQIAATGLPHSLYLRPGSGPALTDLARRRKMSLAAEVPLMALGAVEAAGSVVASAMAASAGAGRSGFTIRQLGPGEAPVLARVASPAFGLTDAEVLRLHPPDAIRHRLMRCYLGKVDGRPASTATVTMAGGYAVIHSVATLPGFRGRGLGTALTARAAADALAAGASWCWLLSTRDGYRVYSGLGFRAIETWQLWTAARGPPAPVTRQHIRAVR